ncbi:MAG TPA: NAD(P) transhydrogenase subunit alpha [Thermoplasmata archaeon]|jgi:NAD(P) transhydrogenase subunit alpha|nr:NAD(P) transhydrogenase subunit alpha [Thermoplasmata archaeon]
MPVRIAVPVEVTPGEKRVALTPDVVKGLTKSGVEVAVESGAGAGSRNLDEAYSAVGAQIVSDRSALFGTAAIVLKVQPPTSEEIGWMKPGTVVVAQMNASRNLDAVTKMRDAKLTAFALELLPRITRAQSMDVLSSQATVAGYECVLIGSSLCSKFLPMLTTAAGTIRPGKVLVLGAGVAGLMAIATAKRLGAVVEAYDVRRAAGEQVRSLGAKFLELQINAEGGGGYARELTDEEKKQEQAMLAKALGEADIIITTAAIPGRKAPILVRKENVTAMRPGAVVVDLAAESGGNCELTKPGENVMVGAVTVAGPLNLPSRAPLSASQMYAKNLESFLTLLISKEKGLTTDYSDEILAASLLCKDGAVTHKPTADLLAPKGAA